MVQITKGWKEIKKAKKKKKAWWCQVIFPDNFLIFFFPFRCCCRCHRHFIGKINFVITELEVIKQHHTSNMAEMSTKGFPNNGSFILDTLCALRLDQWILHPDNVEGTNWEIVGNSTTWKLHDYNNLLKNSWTLKNREIIQCQDDHLKHIFENKLFYRFEKEERVSFHSASKIACQVRVHPHTEMENTTIPLRNDVCRALWVQGQNCKRKRLQFN